MIVAFGEAAGKPVYRAWEQWDAYDWRGGSGCCRKGHRTPARAARCASRRLVETWQRWETHWRELR